MRASRGERGQTAAEYLGVLCIALSFILVFASTDFPGRIARGVGRQICLTINRARNCDTPRATAVSTPAGGRMLFSEAPEPGGGPPVAPSVGEGGSGDVGGETRGGGSGSSGRAGVRTTTPGQMRFLPNGAGWVQTMGTDDLGRSGGVDFVVNQDALRVPRANRVTSPKGFARVQEWAKQHGFQMNRTHLAPNELGGPGDDAANFVTAPERFNKSTMRRWENKFKQLMRQGDTIHVQETPIYKGRELVPRSVQIDVWRETDHGDVYVTGECLNVWPDGPPPRIPTG